MPRLSQIDGLKVLDATGRCFGRVHDLRTRGGGGDDRFEVTTILFGGPGLLERLGIGRDRRDRVAWARVASFDKFALILKDEFTPP
jgi:hypothetical protein